MADEGARPPEDESPVDRWLEPFFSESLLWPVLGVVVLCLATLGASSLLVALREGSLTASAALLLLAGMSAELWWRSFRRRKLGRGAALVAALWLLSGLLAALVHRLQLF